MSEHIVRQTRQKDAIRDVLNGCDEFISAQELHRKLEDRGEHIGLATVYRQLNALAEAGLSIPEDISVMGYDGIYLSRVVKPSLVTYQQNTKALGRLAADKLIELIEHPRVTLPEQIRVSGKLLDGGSVRIL